ncbi:unnamed protein product [Brachionus calyciflorus]|uniref:Uncharacterized protein n=1 Tax=Brachionus calyciflorus TaxID=104777 RepID=A0A814E7J7_9BILA|nr:unnamed protein product [Brachionus calyciflorus]
MHTKQLNNEGLMPDSGAHVARLESKLKKIKNSNQSTKVTGKSLVASLNEFNQIYMQVYMKNGQRSDVTEQNSILLETVSSTYLERRLLPEQPISTEETQSLIENDILSNTITKPEDRS